MTLYDSIVSGNTSNGGALDLESGSTLSSSPSSDYDFIGNYDSNSDSLAAGVHSVTGVTSPGLGVLSDNNTKLSTETMEVTHRAGADAVASGSTAAAHRAGQHLVPDTGFPRSLFRRAGSAWLQPRRQCR